MLPRLVSSSLARCLPAAARVLSCSNANFGAPERWYAIKVKEILSPTHEQAGEQHKRPFRMVDEASDERKLVDVQAGAEDAPHTAESVLKSADVTSVEAASAALIRLAEVPDGAAAVNLVKFAEITNKIDEFCHRLNAAQLQKCVAATVALGLPADARLVACLENELLWNLRKCRFRFLVQIAPFYMGLQRSDLEKRLYSEISTSIQRRWVEVASLKDVVKLMTTGSKDKYSQEFASRLDDRAVELAACASPPDLQKMVCTLAQKKRRPGPLLRALCYHLARQEMSLTARQMADLMSALHTLSFPDQPLLDRISTDLKLKLPEVKSMPVIRSVFTTVGLLRWRNTSLIDALCDWLVSNESQLEPEDRISALHTLAVVDYLPAGVEDMLMGVFSTKTSSSALPVPDHITFVWSTVLLQRASNDAVRNLFYRLVKDLTSGSGTASATDVFSQGELLKLRNIAQFAKMSKIPVPTQIDARLGKKGAIAAGLKHFVRSADGEAFASSVLHALTHLVPKPKYLKEPSETSFGLRLDAEFVVNEDYEPVPLEKFAASAAKLRKVALFCWNYRDYCLGSDRLTGYSAFARRCCIQSGYTVLDVSHSEFDRRDKVVAKVQFLQKKLKGLKARDSEVGDSSGDAT